MTIYVVEKVEFCNDYAFTVGPPIAAFASESEAEDLVARDTGLDPLKVHEVELRGTAEAMTHLRALLNIMDSIGDSEGYCVGCDACLMDKEAHKDDCPYAAARAFLEAHQ